MLAENRLLAALPQDDYARLAARAVEVSFGLRDVMCRAGGPLDHVYFPRSGIASTILVMQDGRCAEVTVVGNEGMIGLTAALGETVVKAQVICQIPCAALRVPAAAFAAEAERDGRLRSVVRRYVRDVIVTTSRLAACNSLHAVVERCARWLLMTHDRVGGDEFPMTQEFLSWMLGVRRATVTLAAGTLQKAGIIAYRHGQVRVLDRERLEAAACECYRAVRDEFDRPGL